MPSAEPFFKNLFGCFLSGMINRWKLFYVLVLRPGAVVGKLFSPNVRFPERGVPYGVNGKAAGSTSGGVGESAPSGIPRGAARPDVLGSQSLASAYLRQFSNSFCI